MSFVSSTNFPEFPPKNIQGVLYNNGLGQLSFETGLPSSTALDIVGGQAGQVLYQSSPSNTAFLPTGITNQVLTTNGVGNAPSWKSFLVSTSLAYSFNPLTNFYQSIAYPAGYTTLVSYNAINRDVNPVAAANSVFLTLSGDKRNFYYNNTGTNFANITMNFFFTF